MSRNQILLDWLTLDERSEVALFRQLYLALRTAIVESKLVAGCKLPSSRTLSKQLGISRNTVVNAYELLISEGYLTAHSGSATQVTSLFEHQPNKNIQSNSSEQSTFLLQLSKTGSLFLEEDTDLKGIPTVEAFLPGNPDHTEFPLKIWKSKIAKQYKSLSLSNSIQEVSVPLSESHTQGYEPLRESISLYLRTSRMLSCDADQVFVFTSCRAALDFTCRMLCNQGEKVLVEEPGYDTAKVIARMNGLQPVPVDVDRDGLQINLQKHCDASIKLAYVTPSHQWPTGVSLSLERRQTLLEWAVLNDSWIIEDDYDSEFRFTQKPLSTLQGLDQNQKVIYIGSFSKVLVPSIQTAYLVVPKKLITAFERAFWYTVQRPPIHGQQALAEFITEGHFTSQIRKMRRIYDRRQMLFVESLNKYLPNELRIERPPGGMQITLPLPNSICAEKVSRRAAAFNLHVRPMSIYSESKNQVINALHLGFAVVSDRNIRPKTQLLCKVIKECK